MQDSFGRTIDYLRISVTDRCNLRCVYCMPEEGMSMTTHEALLTFDEMIRVCTIMAAGGLKKIKLTGGEPLIRRNLEELVAGLKKIPGIESVTLTTNGVLLKSKIQALSEAGIDAVNISLDTMNRTIYEEITRRDELLSVMEGIEAMSAYPDIACKINCVPLGHPSGDAMEVLKLAKDANIHVRFIEMMPIGLGKEFEVGEKEEELLQLIEKTYGTPYPIKRELGNGPCHYYEIPGFCGKVGFISAISHKFCESCNRVRLTSQGYLKTCLQYETGGDLKEMLRNGTSNQELFETIQKLIQQKPKAHCFLETHIKNENAHGMSQIGG